MRTKRKYKVFLGIPIGGDFCLSVATYRAVLAQAQPELNPHELETIERGSSALTGNFNQLWCDCINKGGYDWFVMLHSDICPRDLDWLDQLLAIAEREEADVCSVIVAIKDRYGLTSTAFDTSRWTPRRLTMREVLTLPPTFGNDVARERFGGDLLLNTGVMAVRLGRPWQRRVCFQVDNLTYDAPDGSLQTAFEPEDWRFSRWCHAEGLKLVATREVAISHLGAQGYPNDGAWGTMEVDVGNLVNSARGAAGFMPRR